MAFNPSKQSPILESATQRKNQTNDPDFVNDVGYYPYDLSHTEVLTPLFGLVTPSMNFITAPGDRHVVNDDLKTILNQINGNFLNTVNQYVDSFFVSNKTLLPYNWDKLIPNPVKGDDIPHSARPVVPLSFFFRSFVDSTTPISFTIQGSKYELIPRSVFNAILEEEWAELNDIDISFAISIALYLAYITSRGQLLDYLGFQFDLQQVDSELNYENDYQTSIDHFYNNLLGSEEIYNFTFSVVDSASLTEDTFTVSPGQFITSRSELRDFIMSAFEDGKLVYINDLDVSSFPGLTSSISYFISNFIDVFYSNRETPESIDSSENPFSNGHHFNISKCLAYQLSIAEYFTNDTVDNVFTSDLFMQLLRGVMYPGTNGYTTEPVFDYNGVPTEYDLISYGGFYSSLLNEQFSGCYARRIKFASLMFLLRRSLRYGDYFSTGRTRMLAVGQLSIPVDSGVSVNPVDVTLNLVTQRFLNAANRVGNEPLRYYASIFGIVPSDRDSKPRFIAHRKVELLNQVTNNTANNQGAQTTNLVGTADNIGYDVFIDDFGVIISVTSFDVLPIYTSGIDSDNYLSDRYEYFNPMMQNIGDQTIRLSELVGFPSFRPDTFAYVVRNAEYKYKVSRAHGALCRSLPGFLLRFPLNFYANGLDGSRVHINPDFIRDKPSILDAVVPQMSGLSPGQYFHFITSVQNNVKSARLIQKAPGILF